MSFFVLYNRQKICRISGSSRNDPKWSKITKRITSVISDFPTVLPWCPRFPIYEPFDLQLAGRLAAPHGDPEALAVLLKVRFAGRRGGHVSTQKWLRIRQRDTSKHCVTLDATNYVRVSTIESIFISSMTQFDPLIPSQPIPWRHQTLLQRFEFRSNCQIHTGSNMMIISVVMTLGSHASS